MPVVLVLFFFWSRLGFAGEEFICQPEIQAAVEIARLTAFAFEPGEEITTGFVPSPRPSRWWVGTSERLALVDLLTGAIHDEAPYDNSIVPRGTFPFALQGGAASDLIAVRTREFGAYLWRMGNERDRREGDTVQVNTRTGRRGLRAVRFAMHPHDRLKALAIFPPSSPILAAEIDARRGTLFPVFARREPGPRKETLDVKYSYSGRFVFAAYHDGSFDRDPLAYVFDASTRKLRAMGKMTTAEGETLALEIEAAPDSEHFAISHAQNYLRPQGTPRLRGAVSVFRVPYGDEVARDPMFAAPVAPRLLTVATEIDFRMLQPALRVCPAFLFAGKGRFLEGTAAGKLRLHNLQDPRRAHDPDVGEITAHYAAETGAAPITVLAATADRRIVAAGSWDGSVTVWPLSHPDDSYRVTGFEGPVRFLRVAGSPRQLIVTSGPNGEPPTVRSFPLRLR